MLVLTKEQVEVNLKDAPKDTMTMMVAVMVPMISQSAAAPPVVVAAASV